MTRKALGRGLSALIPEQPEKRPPSAAPTGSDYFHCPIVDIEPDRLQPRQQFEEDDLDELVQSLREVGMVQPLIVRKRGEKHVLIAGERRWRAAQRAGLHRVPVVVREADDLAAFEMALVENLQRAELNPIEEADAYQRLIDDYGYTQAQLAERIGKDRATIANTLRLNKLPEQVQRALISKLISSGHARALLAVPDTSQMVSLMREAVDGKLTVRQVESRVKKLLRPQNNVPQKSPSGDLSANERDLQDQLTEALKTRVSLRVGRRNAGKIEIHYGSLDELDRLLKVLLS